MRVEVTFTGGLTVTDERPEAGTTYSGTTWVVGNLNVHQARELVIEGTFQASYTARARSLGSDQVDGNAANDTATWFAGPAAPGSPVIDFPADRFFCVEGDDDGGSGYDTSNVQCLVTVSAPANQTNAKVTVNITRVATVPAGHVLHVGIGVEKIGGDLRESWCLRRFLPGRG